MTHYRHASEARQSMPLAPADDGISLLEILQVLADNLRLLELIRK